jgi:hypothetical protein
MSDDLVKRIREFDYSECDPWATMEEACEEIERLRAALKTAREALENPPFIQAQDTEWDEGVNYAIAAMQRHVLAAMGPRKKLSHCERCGAPAECAQPIPVEYGCEECNPDA